MKAYIFPGQGSQVKGMGGDLFDEFEDLTQKADEILDYSIKKLCLENPDRKLKQTQFTQPALYVVNALTYLKKVKDGETIPDFVAGHSLGEYNALLAANAYDFETGLKLVKKRGDLMSRASGGAMAAVLGLTEEETKNVLQTANLDSIDIANLNALTQIVISGTREDIEKAQPVFEKEDATYIPLNVSAAFHSRYMQNARDEFEDYLKEFTFQELNIPVISNVTATPYQQGDIVQNLAEQLRSSVRWSDSVQYMLARGVTDFEELGPGDVLTKLVTRIKSDEPPQTASTRDENTEKSLGADENTVQSEESQINKRDTTKKNVDDVDSEEAGRAAYKKRIEAVHHQIAEWNQNHPIGTKVTCDGFEDQLQTRTEAMMLFGHRAAIYMEGYNGYFALDDISPG